MALTNAERQAAFKARKAETLEALAQQNAALLAEVAGMVTCTCPCTTSYLSPLKASVKRLAGLAVCHNGRLMVRGSVG